MRELVRDAAVYGSWLCMGFAMFGLAVYLYNATTGADVLGMTGDKFLFGCLTTLVVGECILMHTCGNYFLSFLGLAAMASSPIIMGTGLVGMFYPLGLNSAVFVVMGVIVLILGALAGSLDN